MLHQVLAGRPFSQEAELKALSQAGTPQLLLFPSLFACLSHAWAASRNPYNHEMVFDSASPAGCPYLLQFGDALPFVLEHGLGHDTATDSKVVCALLQVSASTRQETLRHDYASSLRPAVSGVEDAAAWLKAHPTWVSELCISSEGHATAQAAEGRLAAAFRPWYAKGQPVPLERLSCSSLPSVFVLQSFAALPHVTVLILSDIKHCTLSKMLPTCVGQQRRLLQLDLHCNLPGRNSRRYINWTPAYEPLQQLTRLTSLALRNIALQHPDFKLLPPALVQLTLTATAATPALGVDVVHFSLQHLANLEELDATFCVADANYGQLRLPSSLTKLCTYGWGGAELPPKLLHYHLDSFSLMALDDLGLLTGQLCGAPQLQQLYVHGLPQSALFRHIFKIYHTGEIRGEEMWEAACTWLNEGMQLTLLKLERPENVFGLELIYGCFGKALECLPGLEVLDCSSTQLWSRGMLQQLTVLTGLTAISLHDCSTNSKHQSDCTTALTALTALPALKHLRVSGRTLDPNELLNLAPAQTGPPPVVAPT
jgi:hypothetical protein